MPPLPHVPLTCRVAVSGTVGTTPWANVFYLPYSLTGSPPLSAAGVQAIADKVWTEYTGTILTFIAQAFSVTNVHVVDLHSGTGFSADHSGLVLGTLTGAPPTPQSCVLVKHNIAARYRGGHPRTYVPPPAAASIISGNQWPSATVSGVQTQFNLFVSHVNAFTNAEISSVALATVSYIDKDSNPTPPYHRATPLVYPWISSTVEAVVATQRRRTGR